MKTTEWTIRNRIYENYYNINSYLTTINTKIFVQKKFIMHLLGIEKKSRLLNCISNEINIKEKELKDICLLINEDSLFKDFITHNYRVKIEYLPQIEKYYQEKIEEYKLKVKQKIEKNINFKNELIEEDEFEKEKNFIIDKELAKILKISLIDLYKRIIRNSYSIQNYIFTTQNDIYIIKEFINTLNNIDKNSILVDEFSKEIGVNHQTIIKYYKVIDDDGVFCDFRTNKFKIKIKYLQKIRSIIKKDNLEVDLNKYMDWIYVNTLDKNLGFFINLRHH